MYIPHASDLLTRSSIITTPTPLDASPFSLDASGVSGFFGGDEAISAMATVHVYKGRKGLGWYNTPGSYEIAKRYGRIAKSPVFRGLFPGVRSEAAKIFEFDGWQGPRFQAAASGTIIDSTGHLASVFTKGCAAIDDVVRVPGRPGSDVGVTIAKLNKVPPTEVDIIPFKANFLAILPVIASLAACITSAVYRDWFSFSLILWGMFSNGISCFVIGSGTLRFMHPKPAAGSPRGDGILDSGNVFVILRGEEGAVNSVTRGRFHIHFPSKFYPEDIGYCSILLTIQFLAQLFLVPQASLFGQIMFISSLGASWVYNMILSAFDKEKIQQRILLDQVLDKPSLTKYILTTRTTAVVFVLCVLSPDDPRKFLDAYLPNDTRVWGQWKGTVVRKLNEKEELHFTDADWNLKGYTDGERELLKSLYGDAQAAYEGLPGKPTPEKRLSATATLS